MKRIIILTVVFVAIIAVFTVFRQKNEDNEFKILEIGETVLNIEVADTDSERARGLSGREVLAENQGLLFVFEKEGYYSFWMKDMNFPIDIAWLDRDKKVIHIERNVDPETYPKSFTSTSPSLYVLETKAGFFESNKIEIGDIAGF